MASISGRSIATAHPIAAPLRTTARLSVARSAAPRPAGVPVSAGIRSLRASTMVPSQQSAGFQHSAVCAATATDAPADAPAETFQYQAEVSSRRAFQPRPHPRTSQGSVQGLATYVENNF